MKMESVIPFPDMKPNCMLSIDICHENWYWYRSGLLCHYLVSIDLIIFTVILVSVSVLSLFQLCNTLVEKKLQRDSKVCCTWNLYGWPPVCIKGLFEHRIIVYGTCTTNADSVKSMCYLEKSNNIDSFTSVL